MLLTEDHSEAKIGDVGLSQVLQSTYMGMSSNNVGTLTYAAPESILGERCDVRVCHCFRVHPGSRLGVQDLPLASCQCMHRGRAQTVSRASAPASDCAPPCGVQMDIWSFGVVLWELVTHEHPRRGQLREFKTPQECPPCIQDLFDACQQRHPKNRPSAAKVRPSCSMAGLWPAHSDGLSELSRPLPPPAAQRSAAWQRGTDAQHQASMPQLGLLFPPGSTHSGLSTRSAAQVLELLRSSPAERVLDTELPGLEEVDEPDPDWSGSETGRGDGDCDADSSVMSSQAGNLALRVDRGSLPDSFKPEDWGEHDAVDHPSAVRSILTRSSVEMVVRPPPPPPQPAAALLRGRG